MYHVGVWVRVNHFGVWVRENRLGQLMMLVAPGPC